jgi:hypothetical protein
MAPAPETSADAVELKTVLALPTEPSTAIAARPVDLASRAVKVARAPALSAVMALAEIQGAFRHAGCPASAVVGSTEAVDSTGAAVVIADRISEPFMTI